MKNLSLLLVVGLVLASTGVPSMMSFGDFVFTNHMQTYQEEILLLPAQASSCPDLRRYYQGWLRVRTARNCANLAQPVDRKLQNLCSQAQINSNGFLTKHSALCIGQDINKPESPSYKTYTCEQLQTEWNKYFQLYTTTNAKTNISQTQKQAVLNSARNSADEWSLKMQFAGCSPIPADF